MLTPSIFLILKYSTLSNNTSFLLERVEHIYAFLSHSVSFLSYRVTQPVKMVAL